MIVHPLETFWQHVKAGRANSKQFAQVVCLARFYTCLHAGGDEPCTGAKEGHTAVLGKFPERADIRVGRAAIVEQDSSTDEQAACEEVPHHPAGRGEPEEFIRRFQIKVEGKTLEVFE